MEHDNDKTIFRYLDATSNDKLSLLNKEELFELVNYLDRYYLEYRNCLGIDDNITFGIEIEIENFKCKISEYYEFQLLINSIVGNDKWETKNDLSLKNYVDGKIVFGREIASDILTDTHKTWNDIFDVCKTVSLYGCNGDKCGSHVHVGAHILGDSALYWYRFLKLWTIYENVIYRFLYGEYLTHRPMIMERAKPGALFYDSKLSVISDDLNSGVFNLLKKINVDHKYDSSELKYYGMSFWHMLCDDEYNLYEDYNVFTKFCTVECRAANGTIDPIIWQNNINFFSKLLLYCKSDNFDDDMLNRRKVYVEDIFSNLMEYSKIYLEQAVELCDMIFDNNLDKVYFLRQYVKSFEIVDKPFIRAKKFTV